MNENELKDLAHRLFDAPDKNVYRKVACKVRMLSHEDQKAVRKEESRLIRKWECDNPPQEM